MLLITAYILGFISAASLLCGATGFLNVSMKGGAIGCAVFMILSIASLIGAMFTPKQLHKSGGLP